MHRTRIVSKLTPRNLLALFCGLTFLLASCEKVAYEEGTMEEMEVEVESIALEEQANILQQVFKYPTTEMDEAQIRSIYRDFVKRTQAEDRVQLREQLKAIPVDQSAGARVVASKSGTTILSPAGATSNFGYGVTTNRDQVLVGDAGTVSVFAQSGTSYSKVQSLSIPNGAGTILAATADWLAVGEPGSPVNNFANGRVIMFQYQRSSGQWVEKQTLSASGLVLFGEDVAVDLKSMAVLAREGDGGTSIIINYRYNGRSWIESGRFGSGNFFWDMDMQRGRIVANGFQGSDFFNSKVYVYTTSFRGVTEQTYPIPGALSRQISIDNGTILASVLFKPFFAGINNTGFVYTAKNGSWQLTSELTIPVPFNTAAQGLGLKVKGRKALVSLPVFSYCCSGQEGDAVFVYEGSGSNWSLTETLTPTDDNGAGTIYGTETGLAIHGSKVLVGAPAWGGGTGKLYVH